MSVKHGFLSLYYKNLACKNLVNLMKFWHPNCFTFLDLHGKATMKNHYNIQSVAYTIRTSYFILVLDNLSTVDSWAGMLSSCSRSFFTEKNMSKSEPQD
jgi:hypothetical protein